MSSPDREKEKAALTRLAKFCERHNEIADEQTERHAKIAWIMREIEKLDDSRLNRIAILVKQIKE
jgi:hypothetical protein|uniref:Uncharacterized protein n=1 Tax=Siphoviridae sp. ctt5z12 TaxID=2823604 RepID=A0A8S5LBY2_9CAUD|nr:MAG TPA: hypothetical protein [Siphoviridae sp. ctt5z12]